MIDHFNQLIRIGKASSFCFIHISAVLIYLLTFYRPIGHSVCMYVRMHVCMYVCTYVAYVCMYVCTYVCTYVCRPMYVAYVCLYVCMYVCMYECIGL